MPTLLLQYSLRTTDKHHRQIFPDMPVASLVGIGQRRSFDWLKKAHTIQLLPVGLQADFDVAQILAVIDLCEGQGAELLGATQDTHARIATITSHDSCKAGSRHEPHNLRE